VTFLTFLPLCNNQWIFCELSDIFTLCNNHWIFCELSNLFARTVRITEHSVSFLTFLLSVIITEYSVNFLTFLPPVIITEYSVNFLTCLPLCNNHWIFCELSDICCEFSCGYTDTTCHLSPKIRQVFLLWIYIRSEPLRWNFRDFLHTVLFLLLRSVQGWIFVKDLHNFWSLDRDDPPEL
jgi:hypothetical protein